jgi:hypothetical protein
MGEFTPPRDFGSIDPVELDTAALDELLGTAAKRHAEAFVEYLRREAAHTPRVAVDDRIGVIDETVRCLQESGFDTRPRDDGDERVSVFIPPRFLSALKHEPDGLLMSRGDPDADGTRVHGARVYTDAALDGEVLAIHEDALVPNRVLGASRPYLVRTPEGIVAATLKDPDA